MNSPSANSPPQSGSEFFCASGASGGAVEICHILGKEETLRRLRLGLDKLRA